MVPERQRSRAVWHLPRVSAGGSVHHRSASDSWCQKHPHSQPRCSAASKERQRHSLAKPHPLSECKRPVLESPEADLRQFLTPARWSRTKQREAQWQSLAQRSAPVGLAQDGQVELRRLAVVPARIASNRSGLLHYAAACQVALWQPVPEPEPKQEPVSWRPN